MDATIDSDVAISKVAGAIGDPTRARILLSLMDGRARTGTELGAVAEVSPSTVSAHLQRLINARLVQVRRQGKHHYYSLSGSEVAGVLERLSALAGGGREPFISRTPPHLRAARTCYDHIAGTIGVELRERLTALGWLVPHSGDHDETYEVSDSGASALRTLGIDLSATRALRRRFAFGCLDWSERRYHLGGALGAALLALASRRQWVVPHLDSRALRVTERGRREMHSLLGLVAPPEVVLLRPAQPPVLTT
jgi:DNA-binding transcriptional ArsR family regulator